MSVIESHKAPSNSLIVQFLIDQQLINEDSKNTHIVEARNNNSHTEGMSEGGEEGGEGGNCNGHL